MKTTYATTRQERIEKLLYGVALKGDCEEGGCIEQAQEYYREPRAATNPFRLFEDTNEEEENRYFVERGARVRDKICCIVHLRMMLIAASASSQPASHT